MLATATKWKITTKNRYPPLYNCLMFYELPFFWLKICDLSDSTSHSLAKLWSVPWTMNSDYLIFYFFSLNCCFYKYSVNANYKLINKFSCFSWWFLKIIFLSKCQCCDYLVTFVTTILYFNLKLLKISKLYFCFNCLMYSLIIFFIFNLSVWNLQEKYVTKF